MMDSPVLPGYSATPLKPSLLPSHGPSTKFDRSVSMLTWGLNEEDLDLITLNGYKLVNPTENLKPLERVKITSQKLALPTNIQK
jgi:hypothetical protein